MPVRLDPVILDGPLVSDGESLRPIDQIFEGLVGLKPGTTQVVPLLATSWKATPERPRVELHAAPDVKFQDGTPFNAAAVCANFTRWYNFPGPLQSDAVTYYWNTVFGGFAHPAAGSPGPDKSLYKGCKAHGQYNVTIFLNRRSSSFIGALALTNFGIASPTALKKYQADAGTVDSNGVFHPTGTFGTQHPIGTGPFMLQSWQRGPGSDAGSQPELLGREGEARPGDHPADRRQRRPPAGAAERWRSRATTWSTRPTWARSAATAKLKLLDRPAFNVGYVGINQTIDIMNNPLVRQAVAYGLDRASVVRSFYAGRATVADQFLPDQLVGFANKGVPQYPYNPAKSKALLQQAGLTLPVPVDFWYPTSVSRPYMPDPQRNAEAFAASLEKSGFKVTFHSAPWRPDYLGSVQSGKAQLYLLGWTGDFGDPANFLNVHFGASNDQFGFNNPTLFNLLHAGRREPNLAKRAGAVPAGLHPGDEVPADGPVRAHQAGARLPEERQGVHAEPGLARAVLDGLLSGT